MKALLLNSYFSKFRYLLIGALVLMFVSPATKAAPHLLWKVKQERVVTGTVTSQADGSALPGVNVLIKGKTIGTVTDNEGNYRINVPNEDDILLFSFIGYATQEVALNGRTTIDVALAENVQNLKELVVVGYGTQEKLNLTGSVATVEYDEILENRPITNASQALGGQVPGVWVTQTSGQPGSDGALLRIRGWGTLNNAEPMVIINGVEGSIDQVNPHDIKSMSVLKDAASAAIYGSKAANGVILITTKDGKYNAKPQVRLSSSVGFQSLSRKYDLIDNSAEFMEMWNQARENKGLSPTFPENVINDFRNGNDPYLYPNTNFFDHVYRTAAMAEHNISVSGGSENSKYFFSLNRLNQDGIMRRTGSKRHALNLKIETKLNNWLNIGGRLNATKQDSREPYAIGRVTYTFTNGAYPFIPPFNKDGSFGAVQAFNANGKQIVGNRNPIPEIYNGFTKRDEIFTRMDAFVDVTFTDYLTLKSNFTAQNSNSTTDRYSEGPMILDKIYTSTGEKGSVLGYGQMNEFEASRRIGTNFNYTWFNTLNFNKKFGEQHHVSAIAGMQVENTSIKSAFAFRKNAPKVGLTQVSAGTSGSIAEGSMAAFGMMSYFSRVNYAFSDKYLFEVNVRADASSRFAEDYRWGVFPGFSAGWRISEEEFMNDQDLFSELKIRGSWGRLGNQNIAGYWPYLTTITQNFGTSYNFGGELQPGAAVTSLVDESITWETTTLSDVGIEMYFLQNRLSLETTFFNRKTEDIITRLPIPRTLGGLAAPFENVGEMINKGFEINATFLNTAVDRDKFSYSLGANFSYVTNEVTKFKGGKSPDQLYLIREGYSYNSLYAYKAEGIYQTDQEAQEHMHSNGYTPEAGDLRFKDVNEDGVMNSEDLMVIGNTIPKYNFGANLDFSYKGFNLSILLQGLSGVTVDTRGRWTLPLGVSGGTITKRWRDAWTPENTDTDLPQLKINDWWNYRRNSSFFMVDLSFLKVKNIQLGYKFPADILGLQNLYAYINAQNYFTLVSDDYEGFDPERSTFNIRADTHAATRKPYDAYPLPKIISLGVNVGF